LFTRGETQAIVVATLASMRDAQRIDALQGEYTDRFMLHYNFPRIPPARPAAWARPSAAKSAMAPGQTRAGRGAA